MTSLNGSNGSEPNGDGSGQSFADFRARYESARAQLAELQLAEKRGKLVSRAVVERQIAELTGGLRRRLMQIPARITPQLASVDDIRETRAILDGALREALRAPDR